MKAESLKEENQQIEVVMGLSYILADTYTLYLKTQNFHWNVTGQSFQQLHMLFESQYTEMAVAIDEIAERIRALGHRPPGSFKEFIELSSIIDDSKKLNSIQMITSLIRANETISRKAQEASLIARKCDDEVSAGLLTSRVDVHEKSTWILNSLKE